MHSAQVLHSASDKKGEEEAAKKAGIKRRLVQ